MLTSRTASATARTSTSDRRVAARRGSMPGASVACATADIGWRALNVRFEQCARFRMADQSRRAPHDEPRIGVTFQLPTIRADAVDPDSRRAADVDAGVACDTCPVAVGLDDRG